MKEENKSKLKTELAVKLGNLTKTNTNKCPIYTEDKNIELNSKVYTFNENGDMCVLPDGTYDEFNGIDNKIYYVKSGIVDKINYEVKVGINENNRPKTQHRSQSDNSTDKIIIPMLTQIIESNCLQEEMNNTLNDLNTKMNEYNKHLKNRNYILYSISVFLFGILAALIVLI